MTGNRSVLPRPRPSGSLTSHCFLVWHFPQHRNPSVQRLRKESLMSPRFEEATFQNFRVDQANAYNLKLCRRYAEHFDKMVEKNQGLIFYGDVGTGKT